MGSRAVVGMVGEHRRSAIELFGHEEPHEHARQRQRAAPRRHTLTSVTVAPPRAVESRAMVRMVRNHRGGAIQLLSDEQSHEHVRQCERT